MMDFLKAVTGTLSPTLKPSKWEGAQTAVVPDQTLTLDNAVRFGFKIGLGIIMANVAVGCVVAVIYFLIKQL